VSRPLRARPLAPLAFCLAVLFCAGCGRHQLLGPESSVSPARGSATAQVATGPARLLGAVSDEPVHLEGELGPGALWAIDKPAAWNGDLVVYLHGYLNPAEPAALPAIAAFREALLARGYAVAASSYSSTGYAVAEGVIQSHQLSGLFASRVAKPGRTYLFGQSLGGLIGLILSRKYPEQYDGSLLVCGIVGGSREEVQYLGDIRVLFDAVYPNVLPGGLEHPPVITNLNAQVVGPALAAITANPQGVGIIQALARRKLPGANSQEVEMSLLNVLGFAMQGGSDLLDRTHGHSFFDNAQWTYTSSLLPGALVDDINARVARYSVTPDAQAYLERLGEADGPFEIPVLTLHTTRDPVVPVFNEDLLAQVATGPTLLQRRVEQYGHTNFAVGVLMSNFDDLVAWAGSFHRSPA